MHDYLLALIGGSMIGAAAVTLMATHGSIMGVSGILNQLLPPTNRDWGWRLSFIGGVLLAPLLVAAVTGHRPIAEITSSLPILVTAGLLVGTGTALGNGCTSGHGVCGLSRLSTRSLVATSVFMFTAMLTVFVVGQFTGI